MYSYIYAARLDSEELLRFFLWAVWPFINQQPPTNKKYNVYIHIDVYRCIPSPAPPFPTACGCLVQLGLAAEGSFGSFCGRCAHI